MVISGVLSLTGEVTRSSGEVVALFTDNDSFTFIYEDSYGNTGSSVATVDWIDRIPPTCTVTYTPDTNTNQDVVASLTGCSETITGTSSFTFTGDGTFTFTFADLAGNTGSSVATVDWIDKIAPLATDVSYSPSTNTNGDVEVTLTTSEEVQTITGRTG
jgi:hypothetical protein